MCQNAPYGFTCRCLADFDVYNEQCKTRLKQEVGLTFTQREEVKDIVNQTIDRAYNNERLYDDIEKRLTQQLKLMPEYIEIIKDALKKYLHI